MKKIILLGVLMCAAAPLLAQKVFFVFIQSEAGTPFYVKMADKVLSSTASGYLIIPKLKDSTYSLQLGPAPSEGELRFEVAVAQKDRGFLLKKFAEGWALFDLQALTVLKPANAATGFSGTEKIKDNPFVQLLSKASGDTSLLYQPVLVSRSAPAKKMPEAPAAIVESEATASATAEKNTNTALADTAATAVAINDERPDTAAKQETAAVLPAATQTATATEDEQKPQQAPLQKQEPEEVSYKRSVVMRRAESSTVDGFGLVFWDKMEDVVDTIKIFIPNQKVVFAANETVAEQTESLTPKKGVATCSGVATEKDFFRVRKNMAAFDSEAEMVAEAKSNFRKKCFSADQIKNLSSLFLTQQGKWLFLEAAYPFTADKAGFAALQSELHDDTYIARFKALTNQ